MGSTQVMLPNLLHLSPRFLFASRREETCSSRRPRGLPCGRRAQMLAPTSFNPRSCPRRCAAGGFGCIGCLHRCATGGTTLAPRVRRDRGDWCRSFCSWELVSRGGLDCDVPSLAPYEIGVPGVGHTSPNGEHTAASTTVRWLRAARDSAALRPPTRLSASVD
ncbi:unnamed protein product [Lampetra fluviatilis]